MQHARIDTVRSTGNRGEILRGGGGGGGGGREGGMIVSGNKRIDEFGPWAERNCVILSWVLNSDFFFFFFFFLQHSVQSMGIYRSSTQ